MKFQAIHLEMQVSREGLEVLNHQMNVSYETIQIICLSDCMIIVQEQTTSAPIGTYLVPPGTAPGRSRGCGNRSVKYSAEIQQTPVPEANDATLPCILSFFAKFVATMSLKLEGQSDICFMHNVCGN